MKELQIYNNLLQLPLFLGISKNDISLIVAHTRFNFSTIRAGKDIVKEGDKIKTKNICRGYIHAGGDMGKSDENFKFIIFSYIVFFHKIL